MGDITLGGLNASSVDIQLTPECMNDKTDSEDEVFGLGRVTICSFYIPFSLPRIELGLNHNRVESAVLFDTNYLVDVIRVIAQDFVARVVVGPIPRLVYLGPVERVLWDFGIDAGAWVAVPSPGTTCIIASLENDCF